jgi:hypothetical protein
MKQMPAPAFLSLFWLSLLAIQSPAFGELVSCPSRK